MCCREACGRIGRLHPVGLLVGAARLWPLFGFTGLIVPVARRAVGVLFCVVRVRAVLGASKLIGRRAARKLIIEGANRESGGEG